MNHATKAELINAAVEIATTSGIASLSMEKVRSKVGVSNGSLFHHFPNKDSLIASMYVQIVGEYQTKISDVIDHEQVAEAVIQGMVEKHVQWVKSNPQKAKLLSSLGKSALPSTAIDTLGEMNKASFGYMYAWKEQATIKGALKPMPDEIFLALVFGPVLSLTGWLLDNSNAEQENTELELLKQAAWRSVKAS